MSDLVPRPVARAGVRGRSAGSAGRREPGRAAPPRRRRPLPAGPVGRRHRRRRPARRRGLGGPQDRHRGGGLPPLPRAAGAGHLVLRHREPLGRAPHLDPGRAGRRHRGRHHLGPHRPGVGPPVSDPGRVRRALRRGARRPPGEGPPRPPRSARRRARRLRRGRSASPTSTSSVTSTTPPAGRSSSRRCPSGATSARPCEPRSSTAPPSSATPTVEVRPSTDGDGASARSGRRPTERSRVTATVERA